MLTILALTVFISLGFWQLERAQHKKQNYQDFLLATEQTIISLSSVIKQNIPAADLQWRQVSLTGEFDSGPIILLDNQILNGVAGYNMIADFMVNGSDKRVLLNLGWIGAEDNYGFIAPIQVPRGHLDLTGPLKMVEDNLFIDEIVFEGMKNNIIRVQEINIDEVGVTTGTKYHPFIILLGPEIEFGLHRDWQPIDSGPARHQAYVMQWFRMALVVLVIFVGLIMKKS